MATASGLRSILQRHLANAITTPSTFFQVSGRRSDAPRLTSGADPYSRRSTLNMPSGLPSRHVISSLILINCSMHTTVLNSRSLSFPRLAAWRSEMSTGKSLEFAGAVSYSPDATTRCTELYYIFIFIHRKR